MLHLGSQCVVEAAESVKDSNKQVVLAGESVWGLLAMPPSRLVPATVGHGGRKRHHEKEEKAAARHSAREK